MIVASLFIMMTLSACGGKEDIPEADSSIPESENVYTEETDKNPYRDTEKDHGKIEDPAAGAAKEEKNESYCL